jgi:hypothetical protein
LANQGQETLRETTGKTAMSKTLTNHIRLDDNDVAWLDDSNIKVI